MPEANEHNEPQVDNESNPEVTVNGERFVFKKLDSGKYMLWSAETYDHMGMPFKARAAAELAKKLGKEIEFDHNGATAKVDYSTGEVVYKSDTPWLQELLVEAFDSGHKDKVKTYVREWMQKDEVRGKFQQIIVELGNVEAAGKYNNLFESEDVATALVEAVNNMRDIHKEDDPLSRAASLIYELTSDLQEPWDADGAGFDDYTQALTYVTHEAYRQFKTRHQRN